MLGQIKFFGIIATIYAIAFCSPAIAAELVEQNLDYTDHLQERNNPGRGFAPHKGFYLSPNKVLDLQSNGTVYNDFMRFLVDIGGFSSGAWTLDENQNKVSRGISQPLDSAAIQSIHLALDSLRRRGGTCTIRVSYDDDCRGKQEPDFETLLTHTKQIAEAYKGYEDVIHYVEFGMFGTCGEQNGSLYTQEQMAQALQVFLENSPDEIKVGMRSPYVVATWLGLKDTTKTGWDIFGNFDIDSAKFEEAVQAKAKYIHRVGLYNDGYLGSDSDLGTVGSPLIKRETMVRWLEKYGATIPYGGDFVYNYNDESRPPLNTAEYMSYEGFRTHTSYIGGGCTGEKYHFMDTTKFKGINTEYAGIATGKEYIRDHLGYRFVLRESRIVDSINVGGNFIAKIKLQNVGFANNLMVKKATLILRKEDSFENSTTENEPLAEAIELPLDIDPTKIISRKLKMKTSNPTETWNGSNFADLMEEKPEFNGINELDLNVAIPKDLPPGTYKAFLRFSHYGNYKTDNNFHTIQFANDFTYFDSTTGSNYIGKLVISDKVSASFHTNTFRKTVSPRNLIYDPAGRMIKQPNKAGKKNYFKRPL